VALPEDRWIQREDERVGSGGTEDGKDGVIQSVSSFLLGDQYTQIFNRVAQARYIALADSDAIRGSYGILVRASRQRNDYAAGEGEC
jgi:hypothetical protein